MDRSSDCNPYSGGVIPPCSALLNDTNPIIKDGKLIYRNLNRIYCFISTSPKLTSVHVHGELLTANTLQYLPFTSTNLQISITTFIIGLYIDQVQRGSIKYEKNTDIHPDKAANDFIHKSLESQPEITMEYTPKLALLYSNGNAVLPLVSTTWEITPLNYYVLFALNRFENDPGLFFGNNSFVTGEPINFDLSLIDLQFPS